MLLALLGAALLIAACDGVADVLDEPAVDAADLPSLDHVDYVALGDSIAAGTAPSTTYVERYADWVADETGAEVTVDNRAVPGWTVDDLLAALRDDAPLRTAVEGADLVTFNIGGNDLLRPLRLVVEGRCGGPDGDDCVREAIPPLLERWDDLLDVLLALTDGDGARLRTMDLYPPRGLDRLPAATQASLLEHLEEVNDRLRTAAERRGIPVAAVHDRFRDAGGPQGTGLLAEDGVHPTAEGHTHIAEALAELGTAVDADAS